MATRQLCGSGLDAVAAAARAIRAGEADSPALAVLRELGLPDDAEHVNPHGGAIALGHPLGASGAGVALTAALELHNRAARRALATMCVGVGQGVSVPFEAP